MRALTSIDAVWRGDFKTSPAQPRALEKASKSGASSQDGKQPPHETPRRKPRLQVELVCQAGTKAHDPYWDGPRLTPHFVTQVLAQAMAPERARLVRTPYGKSDESFVHFDPTGDLLDEKL
jgi:hypothetical protein